MWSGADSDLLAFLRALSLGCWYVHSDSCRAPKLSASSGRQAMGATSSAARHCQHGRRSPKPPGTKRLQVLCRTTVQLCAAKGQGD